MCWSSWKKPNRKVAKRDIKVYKILRRSAIVNKGWPELFPLRCYDIDKITPKIDLKIEKSGSGKLYLIHKGYHSFNLSAARRRLPRIGGSTNQQPGRIAMAEFVIPKGVGYYKDQFEYVSEQIKFVRYVSSRNLKTLPTIKKRI